MDEYIAKKDVLSKIESAAMWNRSLAELYDEIRDMQPVDATTENNVGRKWIPVAERLPEPPLEGMK